DPSGHRPRCNSDLQTPTARWSSFDLMEKTNRIQRQTPGDSYYRHAMRLSAAPSHPPSSRHMPQTIAQTKRALQSVNACIPALAYSYVARLAGAVVGTALLYR